MGPIGVLCIRRALANGRATGFASGLGAASADAIYGSIAAFGLTIVSSFLVSQQLWLRLVGGLFLVYLGVRTFLSKPTERAAEAGSSGLLGAYASTFLLTLTNPMTVISFAAVFAGLGVGSNGGGYRGSSRACSGRVQRLGALVAAPQQRRQFIAFPNWCLKNDVDK